MKIDLNITHGAFSRLIYVLIRLTTFKYLQDIRIKQMIALGGIWTPDLDTAVSTFRCGCEQRQLTFARALPLDLWVIFFMRWLPVKCHHISTSLMRRAERTVGVQTNEGLSGTRALKEMDQKYMIKAYFIILIFGGPSP